MLIDGYTTCNTAAVLFAAFFSGPADTADRSLASGEWRITFCLI